MIGLKGKWVKEKKKKGKIRRRTTGKGKKDDGAKGSRTMGKREEGLWQKGKKGGEREE